MTRERWLWGLRLVVSSDGGSDSSLCSHPRLPAPVLATASGFSRNLRMGGRGRLSKPFCPRAELSQSSGPSRSPRLCVCPLKWQQPECSHPRSQPFGHGAVIKHLPGARVEAKASCPHGPHSPAGGDKSAQHLMASSSSCA